MRRMWSWSKTEVSQSRTRMWGRQGSDQCKWLMKNKWVGISDWDRRWEEGRGREKKRKKKSRSTWDDSLVSKLEWLREWSHSQQNFSSCFSRRFLSFFYSGCPSELKETPSQLVLTENNIGFWCPFCIKRTWGYVTRTRLNRWGRSRQVLGAPRSDDSQENPKHQSLGEPPRLFSGPTSLYR